MPWSQEQVPFPPLPHIHAVTMGNLALQLPASYGVDNMTEATGKEKLGGEEGRGTNNWRGKEDKQKGELFKNNACLLDLMFGYLASSLDGTW